MAAFHSSWGPPARVLRASLRGGPHRSFCVCPAFSASHNYRLCSARQPSTEGLLGADGSFTRFAGRRGLCGSGASETLRERECVSSVSFSPDVCPSSGGLPGTADEPFGAPPPAVASAASVEVFESELCLEIDKLICSCEDAEDILRLLVSHRGALYVHNLVTALKALADMAVKGPFNRSTQQQQGQPCESQQEIGELGQEGKQQEEPQEQQGTKDDLPPQAALLRARLTGSQPSTWPRDGSSFCSFFSLLSQAEAQAERRHNQRSTGETIVRDDRYHLLLQDLRRHRRVLTFQAAVDVALSLRALRHPHYPLLSSLLPALTKGPLPTLDRATEGTHEPASGIAGVFEVRQQVKSLLAAADVYRWAGYTSLPFYDRVAHILEGPIEGSVSSVSSSSGERRDESLLGSTKVKKAGVAELSAVHSRTVSGDQVMRCSPTLVAQSLTILSRVSLSDSRAFAALCLQGAAGAPLASAAEVTAMAAAAAAKAPRTPEVTSLLEATATEVFRRPRSFSIFQLSQVLVACSAASLHFPFLISLVCERVTPHLSLAARTGQKALLTPDAVCALMRDVTFFDPHTTVPSCPSSLSAGQARCADLAEALVDAGVHYLEGVIDVISPKGAAEAVFALAATKGAPEDHAYLLSFLFRKIGKDTSWEGMKKEVFDLFLSHKLLFPWLEHELPLRCVTEGLRAWCVHRGGYGVPYPEEAAEVSALLLSLGVLHETNLQLQEGPYEVDIVLTASDGSKFALIVSDDCARNSPALCGSGLLQSVHLRHLGFSRVLAIPREPWRRATWEGKRRLLLSRLEALNEVSASKA